ncbi:DHS-like NAD/FAD-binding domain-containing protein [Xylona heveae TC161]|uniref:DHS-like NAD/FAD-binding domain-containing protein n=1 Tax=Xylona heveae (strain CBS 132557 / TC161) TaxID=1328760 RepID=A0A165FLC2_XYLHT|nr:DHS-like NAD/FAD-binding domain-containing protein [Xylona heveae TC161]KZF21112.1 DHS-like NAD/FAD-binding domain-containing protein [Xylona heveae TC161]
MASTVRSASIPPADLQSFHAHLKSSKRILALLGAGLSASSGLPTFRGAGGLWRTYDAASLATPEAFDADPGLVWQFYSYRRHMALKAMPNKAHYALAKLAQVNDEFMTLSQNVDGLSQRANHPRSKLQLLHGSLFDVKCTDFYCDFVEHNNFRDPIVPSLTIPTRAPEPLPSGSDRTGSEAAQSLENAMEATKELQEEELDIADEDVALPELRIRDLPRCPKCHTGLLRPGVVWFGEQLPREVLDTVDDWISQGPIDLILVIGTSAKVYPAAGYVDIARAKGAKVAVVNVDRADAPGGYGNLMDDDWFFQGDASIIVPEILKEVIGELPDASSNA